MDSAGIGLDDDNYLHTYVNIFPLQNEMSICDSIWKFGTKKFVIMNHFLRTVAHFFFLLHPFHGFVAFSS